MKILYIGCRVRITGSPKVFRGPWRDMIGREGVIVGKEPDDYWIVSAEGCLWDARSYILEPIVPPFDFSQENTDADRPVEVMA